MRLKKISKHKKQKLIKYLNINNIEARSVWTPLHLQKKYKNIRNMKYRMQSKCLIHQ